MNRIILQNNYELSLKFKNLRIVQDKHVKGKKRAKRHHIKTIKQMNLNDLLINSYKKIKSYRINKDEVKLKNEYFFNLNKKNIKFFYNMLIIKNKGKTSYYLIDKNGKIDYNLRYESFGELDNKFILKLLNLKRMLKEGKI